MSATINFSTLTLNTEEARSTEDLVFESVFVKANPISLVHDIRTGVEMDKFIPILGQYGLVGKISAGNCSSNVEAGQIPTTQKKWTPKLITFRLEHCQEEIPDLIKFWKKARIAASTWEEIDDEMMAFINDRVVSATQDSILRISSFGDLDASPVGDALGTELLTAGLDKTYFNMLDGLWKQIFTDQALGTPLTYRHTLTKNAEATKALQLALGATDALDAFRAMYDNIDPRAFENGELKFQVTRTMHSNWVAYLEDKSLAFTLTTTEEGKVQPWSYRGIPIEIRYDWDRGIRAWHDLGATYYLPNRAILTKTTNIPIGTSDEESMSEVRSFYDFKDKKHYIDVAYKLDLKLLLEYELACAY